MWSGDYMVAVLFGDDALGGVIGFSPQRHEGHKGI